jgi:RNA polymerase sigma factor (sigma-70 family)
MERAEGTQKPDREKRPGDVTTGTKTHEQLKNPDDPGVWQKLIKRCGPLIKSRAAALGIPKSDLEDFVTIVFAEFAKKATTLERRIGQSTVRAFLMWLTKDRVLDELRKRDALKRNEHPIGMTKKERAEARKALPSFDAMVKALHRGSKIEELYDGSMPEDPDAPGRRRFAHEVHESVSAELDDKGRLILEAIVEDESDNRALAKKTGFSLMKVENEKKRIRKLLTKRGDAKAREKGLSRSELIP